MSLLRPARGHDGMSTADNMLAPRIHDLAGDVRALRRGHLPPEIEAELFPAEQALERAAARAETEY